MRIKTRGKLGGAITAVVLMVTGCTTWQTGMTRIQQTWSDGIETVTTRLVSPTEQRFMARVQTQCAHYKIGGQAIEKLVAQDQPFQQLTRQLYRGTLSSDHYIAQLLKLHPAADGNIPAAGCVIDQLNACLSGNCAPPASESLPAAAAPEQHSPPVKTAPPTAAADSS